MKFKIEQFNISKQHISWFMKYFLENFTKIKISIKKRNLFFDIDNIEIFLQDKSNINKMKLAFETCLFLPNIIDKRVSKDDIVIETNYNNNTTNKFLQCEKKECYSFELGSKLAGSKNVVFETQGNEIMLFLQKLFSFNAECNSYKSVWIPEIVSDISLFKSGHLINFYNMMFKIDERKYMTPTSEVGILNLLSDSKIDTTIPVKLYAINRCFRNEVGNYGVRDRLRTYEFSKCELFVFCKHEDVENEIQTMLNMCKRVLKYLKLPFRILLNSVDNTSVQSAYTYDVEVYTNTYGWVEVSSISNCDIFQSIRSNIKDSKTGRPVVTLNGTCLALNRILFCILDSYQSTEFVLQNIQNDKKNTQQLFENFLKEE